MTKRPAPNPKSTTPRRKGGKRQVLQPGEAPQHCLNDVQKEFVVTQLACFETPSTVAARLKEEHGAEITRQTVQQYDPTKWAGRKLIAKWRTLFESARAEYLERAADVGIAQKMVRLRMLDDMAVATFEAKDYEMTAKLLEQGAKEVGDSYSNKKQVEHTGPDGGPVKSTLTVEFVG